MAVCSLFNRMLLLTDLIPLHLLNCGQTVMTGCNHTSFEWTRAVRHIYGIIRHNAGPLLELYILTKGHLFFILKGAAVVLFVMYTSFTTNIAGENKEQL